MCVFVCVCGGDGWGGLGVRRGGGEGTLNSCMKLDSFGLTFKNKQETNLALNPLVITTMCPSSSTPVSTRKLTQRLTITHKLPKIP